MGIYYLQKEKIFVSLSTNYNMDVAFISECNTFYNILTKSINAKYPNINFFYYDSPSKYSQQLQPGFSFIIVKITNYEKYDFVIQKMIQAQPQTKFIGLVINSHLKLSEKLLAQFTHVFTDAEIEDKLNLLFHDVLVSDKSNEVEGLKIDQNKRKYLYLKPEYSKCLYLVYQHKTAAEIALNMNKSKRTIEKYIDTLKEIFEVKRKQDLVDVCAAIIKQ
jgi:DNA-binding NarL/FixJ family response regulator